MTPRLLAALALAIGATGCAASEFASPVLMKANGAAVKAEAPGFACPCWFDVDGDGNMDLVVGQFNEGRMRLFKGQGDGQFAAGEWIQAEGKPAEVPGVW
jgi:hypothetical protein